MVGLDVTRAHSQSERLGIATGITNSGGFFAALVAIFLIGTTLDQVASGAHYTLTQFRVGMSTQYLVWGFGVLMLLRARLAASEPLCVPLDGTGPSFPASTGERVGHD